MTKAWKDCGVCNGEGMLADEPDNSIFTYGSPCPASYHKHVTPYPCPTCVAHWAAVDAVIQERDEARGELAKTTEMLDRTMTVLQACIHRDKMADDAVRTKERERYEKAIQAFVSKYEYADLRPIADKHWLYREPDSGDGTCWCALCQDMNALLYEEGMTGEK